MSQLLGHVQSVSVVIPVYRGEETIADLVAELDVSAMPSRSPRGTWSAVDENVRCTTTAPMFRRRARRTRAT